MASISSRIKNSRWDLLDKYSLHGVLGSVKVYPETPISVLICITLPKTNIAPENGWLEDELPFGMAYFQVLC